MSEEIKKRISPNSKPQSNLGKSKITSKTIKSKNNLDQKDKDKENLLIFLTVFASFVLIIILMFIFNIFNIKTMFFRATTDYDAIIEEIQVKNAKLLEDEERVKELIKKQEEKEKELNSLQNEINERERQLIEQYGILYQAKSDELNSEENNNELSKEANEEKIAKTVKIYEQMDSKDAAKIISALSFSEKVEIFDKMKNAKAAQILSQMDATESAKILSEITKRD